jgi:beta-phosphoglucomutase family hydrolase
VVRLDVRRFQGAVLDLDGVITDTARVHVQAWKQLFDDLLAERLAAGQPGFEPFDPDADYRRYVDGKPRYDGAASFLAARGLDGEVDPVALGDRKNEYFRARLERDGVEVFGGSRWFVREVRRHGWKTAVASASRNCGPVLDRAELTDLFDAVVDGQVAAELELPGKPDPATFLEAARRLAVAPADAIVVEDAQAGVEAGRRGGFGLVVGVARAEVADDLRRCGADVVVGDLGDIVLEGFGA